MSDPNLMMFLTGVVYLFLGVPVGMAFRFADWSRKQQIGQRQLRLWWADRLGTNIKSLGLAVVLTGFVVEGGVLRKIPIVGSAAGIILAAPIGVLITYYSHYLFAWGKRKAEAKVGPLAPGEED